MNSDVRLEVAPAELTAHRRSLKALTGIRFFAAFYVVVFHTRIGQALLDHGHAAAGHFFQNGFLAVPLFFLLSGFILAYTYERQIEAPGDHRRFWEARFARIWPVYAVSLILSSLPGFSFPTPGLALATLTMVQAWNPFDAAMAGTWNFVCWTLSVEALFYLCFPWAQTWIERQSARTQLLTLGIMLLLCIALNSGSRTLGYEATGVFRWIPLPLLHLPEFFTGVAMGNCFLRRLLLATSPASGSMLPGRGLWTYGSALLTIALLCRGPSRWTSLVVLGFSLLIFGLAAEKTLLSRFLSTRAMLLGGGISYSMYLMQMPVKAWVLLACDRLGFGSPTLRIVGTGILLILISLILFKAVEDPARKLLRILFAGLEDRRIAGAQRKRATQ